MHARGCVGRYQMIARPEIREPGDRTKIAVLSNDKRIDPVGACVGMKGVRIQAVVRELNNEKIDVIHWHPDAETFIKRSMAPVTPLMVLLDEDNRRATAIVLARPQVFVRGGR